MTLSIICIGFFNLWNSFKVFQIWSKCYFINTVYILNIPHGPIKNRSKPLRCNRVHLWRMLNFDTKYFLFIFQLFLIVILSLIFYMCLFHWLDILVYFLFSNYSVINDLSNTHWCYFYLIGVKQSIVLSVTHNCILRQLKALFVYLPLYFKATISGNFRLQSYQPFFEIWNKNNVNFHVYTLAKKYYSKL